MLQRRAFVLGDRIKSNKTDNELNEEYVDLMKTQLGKVVEKKASNIFNYERCIQVWWNCK